MYKKLGRARDGKARWIIAEDLERCLALVPPLAQLCLLNIIKHFEEKQTFEGLLPADRAYVLSRLPTSLPLHVTANLIEDQDYWSRCCRQRWALCDVSCYDGSWKRMFFERHLGNLLELSTPPQTILKLVPLCRDYVHRLEVSQLLPPIKEPKVPGPVRRQELQGGDEEEGEEKEEEGEDVSDVDSDAGPPVHDFEFGLLLEHLIHLEELQLVYGVRGCGMNYEWNLFEFTLHNCESLGRAVQSCQTLKVLRLHLNNMDDERCRILVRHLLDHPSLRQLDLSHNLIGDRGARAISKLLTRSALEDLNLYNNQIGGPGTQALAHELCRNTTLRTLSLRLNQVDDEGGCAICSALLTNRTLRSLHLGANEMGGATAASLAKVLVKNDTLTSINVSCNSLGVDGGKALEEGMSHNTSVTEWDVRLTGVSEESECAMDRVVQSNLARALQQGAQEHLSHTMCKPQQNNA